MVCPKCSFSNSQVVDSRDGPESIRRRRECLECRYRFTTYEKVESLQVIVVKKDGDRQRFDPEKIRKGVTIACKNRPVTSAMIDQLVDNVTKEICLTNQEEVSSQEVGRQVSTYLQQLDPVGYLRFTSVYQAFADIGQFEKEIQNIN